jgi:CHAT domain-containing protein/tetratricopeptide (TPR) repeat protein
MAQAEVPAATRDRIRQSLEASAAAEARGDAETTLKFAEQADQLARQALARTDRQRALAVRTLGRLRCDAALQQGDSRSALGFAEEARDAAADANDLETAIDWAAYARRLALLTKDPDGQTNTVSRVSLSLARLELAQARVANDKPRVRDRLRQAVALGEDVLPPDDSSRLTDLLALATLEHRSGSPEEALRCYDRIVALGKVHPRLTAQFLLVALINGAALQVGREAGGETAAADRLVEAASILPVASACDAQVLSHLDETFWQAVVERASERADLSARESWLRETVSRLQASLRQARVPQAWIAQGSLRLARFQFELQRMGATEAVLEAIAPRLADLTAAPLVLGDYWTLRGNVEIELSNFAQARAHHAQAYKYYHDAKHKRQAVALNNLGQVLIRQGDYRIARHPLRVAVELYKREAGFRDDVGLAFALTNYAKAMEGDGDVREAEGLHREAIALLSAAAPSSSAAEALYPLFLCRMNLGVNILGSGEDLDEAGAEFGRARDLAIRAFGADHFHVAEVAVNLGWVALRQGKLEAAREQFVAACDTFRTKLGVGHPRTAEAMGYLARAQSMLGRNDQAARLLTEAMDLREKYLGRLFGSSLSEYDRIALVRSVRIHSESPLYIGLLDTFLELAPRLEIPVSHQYARMLWWKGIVSRHAPPRKDDLEDDQQIRDLAGRREEAIARLRSAATGASAIDLALLDQEVDELERRLAASSPRFMRGRDAAAVTPAQVEASLEPDWALLDVLELRRAPTTSQSSIEDRRYIGFFLRPNHPPVRIDFPGPDDRDVDSATAIDNAVVELREALRRAGDAHVKPAAMLKTSIKDRLDPHLKGVKLLIVSHDGQLHRLPLGALPGGNPGSFWIQELAFTGVPSARSLVARHQGRSGIRAEGALIVGGLDYGKGDPESYRPLPASGVEARTVGEIFEAHLTHIETLSGGDGTLPRLLRSMPTRRFVHIATHGFFKGSEENQGALRGVTAMLDSGLVLSGANSQRPDTLLSSERIALLDLRAVELVVLSACQSALGYVKAGEGTTGLIDAFDRAGADSVICALWQVDDEATAALMTAFYDHLWCEQLSPPHALRAAQLELIRGDKKSSKGLSFANPHFWSAFEVGGVPRLARAPSR